MWNGHMTTDYAILQSIRPRSTWSWNTKMKTWIYLKSNRRRPLDRPIKKKIISKLTRLDVLIIFSEKCLPWEVYILLTSGFFRLCLLFRVARFEIIATNVSRGPTRGFNSERLLWAIFHFIAVWKRDFRNFKRNLRTHMPLRLRNFRCPRLKPHL